MDRCLSLDLLVPVTLSFTRLFLIHWPSRSHPFVKLSMRSHLLLSCKARSSLRFTFSPGYSRSRRCCGGLTERSCCSFASKPHSTQHCHTMPVVREGRKDIFFPSLRSLTLQWPIEERKCLCQRAPGSNLKVGRWAA